MDVFKARLEDALKPKSSASRSNYGQGKIEAIKELGMELDNTLYMSKIALLKTKVSLNNTDRNLTNFQNLLERYVDQPDDEAEKGILAELHLGAGQQLPSRDTKMEVCLERVASSAARVEQKDAIIMFMATAYYNVIEDLCKLCTENQILAKYLPNRVGKLNGLFTRIADASDETSTPLKKATPDPALSP